MHELAKQFRFEAAHTLNRVVETAASRRIHGHSYRAEIVLRGVADAASGMVFDLGLFAAALEETRLALDHHLLNDIPAMGPPTLENLGVWIWARVAPRCPGLARVTVYRDSTGDACSYFGPDHG